MAECHSERPVSYRDEESLLARRTKQKYVFCLAVPIAIGIVSVAHQKMDSASYFDSFQLPARPADGQV